MRVKASARKEAQIAEGDRVRVQIEVVDRSTESEVPNDLAIALKSEGVLDAFKSLPPGKLSFTLRHLERASRPETRKKRIREAVDLAHLKRENGQERKSRK